MPHNVHPTSPPSTRAPREYAVLFVCTGNTCRSPMAEAIGRDVLGRELKPASKVRVASAGISAHGGDAMTPEARHALESLGIDPGRHLARRADEAMLLAADAVYVMTRSHAKTLRELAPEHAGKVHLLDPEGADITDPIGGTVHEYLSTASRLRELIRVRLASLVSQQARPSDAGDESVHRVSKK